MRSDAPQKMLNEYLEQINEHLQGIPSFSRREFTNEIRAHLEEEWKQTGGKDTADMQNILENFGDPEEIAREYREKFPEVPRPEVRSYPPTWLVVVLTAIIWPVGIILAWLSPAWNRKDKIVATLIPLICFGFIFLGGFVAMSIYTHEPGPAGQSETHIEEIQPAEEE